MKNPFCTLRRESLESLDHPELEENQERRWALQVVMEKE